MDKNLLEASARIAFVALVHDIGKFAQRAKLDISKEKFDANLHLYCPYHQEGNYFSHHHAAYTGIAIDYIERSFPDLIKSDLYPFISRKDIVGGEDITDSMINAAANHHKPSTFLQWIIATADRVASGFEREEFEDYNRAKESDISNLLKKNHYQTRLLTLLGQISLTEQQRLDIHQHCYPLKPLSATSIFPVDRQQYEPQNDSDAQQEYHQLWQDFLNGLEAIPTSHRSSWELWLDHFDSLWQCYTQSIPSATFNVKPEVSLYDHSKTTAALATSLWRWHEEHNVLGDDAIRSLKDRKESWDIDKFLLIQGDFFGIQDFIFAAGKETNKNVAKLLRGRSFQVSLFSELAALKVLQACDLPSTSQIIYAAGKFMIVAPNTEKVRNAIKQVQYELNQWFVEHTYGLVGLGLAVLSASCNDFVGDNFKYLITKLFQQLETSKLQRLDLPSLDNAVQEETYSYGVCRLNSYFPAITDKKEEVKNSGLSTLTLDQICIGENLTKKTRLLILDNSANSLYENYHSQMLRMNLFGYRILFTAEEDNTGKFGEFAKAKNLFRCWDFSIPNQLDECVWQGYAHRYINGYIPKFVDENKYMKDRYKVEEVESEFQVGEIKTFDYIACDDRMPKDSSLESFIGQIALSTLKGDVDNLGLIFQKGLEKPTFAKVAALSRQMNLFFSLWLPVYCKNNYSSTYTVFAGGDDFFLIGPWYSTQKLAKSMYEKFASYVAYNPDIHFSAGIIMSKLGLPITHLGDLAEEALEKAKDSGKNAITIFSQSLPWQEWVSLSKAENDISDLQKDFNISTSYLYSLISLAELSESNNLDASMWRSRFYYRTARYVTDKLTKVERDQALQQIAVTLGENGIAKWKKKYTLPLFNYFYKHRS